MLEVLGWMFLSTLAMVVWAVAVVLFGRWGLVAGFALGGLGSLAIGWWQARAQSRLIHRLYPGDRAPDTVRRAAGRRSCAACGINVSRRMAICPLCGSPLPEPASDLPNTTGRRRRRGQETGPGGTTMPGHSDVALAVLFRSLATTVTSGRANYTWRTWSSVLLVLAGVTGALATLSFGVPQAALVLSAGAGAGLAVYRWGPAPD